MKLIYPSAKGLSRAFESIWNLVNEGTFKITNEGISLMAIDPSQISMVNFNLTKDAFLEYEIEDEMKLSIDIDYLKNIMKRARSNEMIKMEDSNGKLKISFETEKTKRSFTIPLLDLSEGVSREPNIEYHNSVKISTDIIKEMIKDASIVSSYIKFVLTPDSFEVAAKSERGELNEVFEKESEEVIELNVETGARAYYPLQYLDDIVKAAGKNDVATLYMETDLPLKLEYYIEKAHAKYYLAPRKEEE